MVIATVLDGSRDNDELGRPRAALLGALQRGGYDVTTLTTRALKLAPCAGCFGCWVKTPGVCVIDDDAGVIAASMMASDLVVYLTPVTFGGYSSSLKRALDRQICLVMPHFTSVRGEIHHRKRYPRYPLLATLGVLPEPDEEAEAIFAALTERNSRNFHSLAHASAVAYAGQSEAQLAATVQSMLSAVEAGR